MTEINNSEANYGYGYGARPLTPQGHYVEYLRQENSFEIIEHQTIGRVERSGQSSGYIFEPVTDEYFTILMERIISEYPYLSGIERRMEDRRIRMESHKHNNNNDSLLTKNITNKTTTKNDECPISYEMIKINDIYVECKQCKYSFSEEAIKTHLHNCSTCPMCREQWKFPIIRYRNFTKRSNLYLKIIAIIKINNRHNYRHNYKISNYNYKTRHNKKWFYGK